MGQRSGCGAHLSRSARAQSWSRRRCSLNSCTALGGQRQALARCTFGSTMAQAGSAEGRSGHGARFQTVQVTGKCSPRARVCRRCPGCATHRSAPVPSNIRKTVRHKRAHAHHAWQGFFGVAASLSTQELCPQGCALRCKAQSAGLCFAGRAQKGDRFQQPGRHLNMQGSRNRQCAHFSLERAPPVDNRQQWQQARVWLQCLSPGCQQPPLRRLQCCRPACCSAYESSLGLLLRVYPKHA